MNVMNEWDNHTFQQATHFMCYECKQTFEITKDKGTTGYGVDADNKLICYSCCGKADEREMRKANKYTLYLVEENGIYKLTNWPGTFTIPVGRVKKGYHNFARVRYDLWFVFDGYIWHGVQYGYNTQICHCKRTKEKSGYEIKMKGDVK